MAALEEELSRGYYRNLSSRVGFFEFMRKRFLLRPRNENDTKSLR